MTGKCGLQNFIISTVLPPIQHILCSDTQQLQHYDLTKACAVAVQIADGDIVGILSTDKVYMLYITLVPSYIFIDVFQLRTTITLQFTHAAQRTF